MPYAVIPSRRRVLGAARARLGELCFADVTDPRRVRGRRHRLADLIRMALLGLLTGARSLRDVEALSEDLAPKVRAKLGVGRHVPDTTLRSLLVKLSHDDLRSLNGGFIDRARRSGSIAATRYPRGVVSMDGKTTMTPIVRGDFAQRQPSQRLGGAVRTLTSTLISSDAFPCLDACPIPASTNEVGHFAVAFEALEARFKTLFEVIMGDAGFLSAANADLVHAADKGYVFQVKENVPSLVRSSMKCFSRPPRETAERDREREDGRWVVRRVTLVDVDPDEDAWDGFRHATQFVRIERIAVGPGDAAEVLGSRVFITNLTRGYYTPQTWLTLLRDRWAVENQNHGTWDIAFGEDDNHWIDEPDGMLAVMLLRRLAYNILAVHRAVTLRSQRSRHMPWRRLFTLLRDALVTATFEILSSFRSRSPSTQ